jgi:hypothetical protein
MNERRGLIQKFRVGEIAENRGLWSRTGRFKKTQIADLHLREHATSDLEEIFESEEVRGHLYLLRRSRSSASSAATREMARDMRDERSAIYALIAVRATSCIERFSSSALLRRAAVSSSVSLRVIAMDL